MSNASLASKLKEWRKTATAASANESDLAFAKEMQAELVSAADEAEDLSNQTVGPEGAAPAEHAEPQEHRQAR